ncbi:MAG: hypothetical protein EA398_18050 [Deltaproteobacteria bacterium]|nr:MAG: hypothetical protein EA398_18050 [Deltaproteobacteria bacterium]
MIASSLRVLLLIVPGLLLVACATADPPPEGNDDRRPPLDRDVTPGTDGDDVLPSSEEPGSRPGADATAPSDPCAACPEGEFCIDDRCQPAVCEPESRRCRGARVFEECLPDGSAWGAPVDCRRTEECDGIECRCIAGDCVPVEPCQPGTTRCRGENVQRCDSSGEFYAFDRACDTDRGLLCSEGECSCEGGDETLCGDRCVDTRASRTHCGACDSACPEPRNCVNGTCRCPSGQTFCGGECVDVQSSTVHCGRCDNACPAGQSCNAGSCTCPTGLESCDGGCVDLENDRNNCGACGRACEADERCISGSCFCRDNLQRCPMGSGDCVDINVNPQHCGGCDIGCSPPRSCVSGICSCPVGQTFCDGTCVDTSTSRTHCGGCNRSCRGECVGGACILGCNCPLATSYCRPGQGICPSSSNGCCGLFGQCVALDTDENGVPICP